MYRKLLHIVLLLFLFLPQTTLSQNAEEIEEEMDKLLKGCVELIEEGNYEEALIMTRLVAEYISIYFNDEYLLHAQYVDMTGDLLSLLDRNKEAIEYFRKALSILDENQYTGTEYARILYNLSDAYKRLHDFEKALLYAFRSAEKYADLTGKESIEYGNILNETGYIYLEKGDIRQAMGYFEKSLAILEKASGESKKAYASALTNTSQAYMEAGMPDKALQLQLEANQIALEEYGNNHLVYIAYLVSTGGIYSDMHDYEKALLYTGKAEEIYRQSNPENNLLYAKILNNYGVIYGNIGDHQQAFKYYEESLKIKIYKKVSDYNIMINIGSFYRDTGNYEKALEYLYTYQEAVTQLAGKNNYSYARSLLLIGYTYNKSGEYEKAIQHYEEAIHIMQQLDMEKHPLTAEALYNSSFYFMENGPFDIAIKLTEKAYDIIHTLYGSNHPYINLILSGVGYAYLLNEEYAKARDIYKFIIPRLFNEVTGNFLFMTEHEREKFWDKMTDFKDLCYITLHNHQEIEFNKINYDMALFSKGILLNSSIEFQKLLRETGNETILSEYEYLQVIRRRINYLYEVPVTDVKKEIENLRQEANLSERSLLQQAKGLGYYTDNLSVSWQDIQQRMTDKDVCIEFIDFSLTNNPTYGALVLSKEMEYPHYIPLFRQDEIENTEFSLTQINNLYNNKITGQLVWNPLYEFISDKKNIYFAATGLLHQLAIEHLKVTDDLRICDIFNLYRLSSTRQLLTERPVTTGYAQAVLYGGLDYNTSPELLREYAQQYETRGNIRLLNLEANPHQLLWRYLPGTLKEVRSIASLLENDRIKTTVYTGQEGIEESFKALSGRSPQLLHIATHGFYFPEESPYVKKHPLFLSDDRTDNSLYHSGLIFAGANHFRDRNNSERSGIDDGILSAKEISALDLRNTDLVVLSACQTGLGEITGDGVFGLQRAFKKAGAGSLLMSLWEVHDKATEVIMTEFYHQLATGQNTREALYLAQQKVKEQTFKMNGIPYSGSDPYFWAGFILLD